MSASDDAASGDAADVVTDAPPLPDDTEYNSNTTAILLVLTFVVAGFAVWLCYAVARRRSPARVPAHQHTMQMDILTDDLRMPEGDESYLSLQVAGGQKDTEA
jgi:hypothetical protein